MARQRSGNRWVIPMLVLLGSGLLAPVGVCAASTTSPVLQVVPFATSPWVPVALAFASVGPPADWLYVLERAPDGATGRLVALDPSGQVTVLAEGLQRPTSLVLGAGAAWGDVPYVLEGLVDRGLGWRVVQVRPSGALAPWPLPPGGVRVPGGATLSPAGPWGLALYVSDAAEGQILRMSPAGTRSVFQTDLAGPRALALAPPASPFAAGLYVATGGAVVQVGLEGPPRVLLEGLLAPSALAFGPGGSLGDDLYLADGGVAKGRLLRITPAGGVTPVAQGLGVINGMAVVRGAPFGPALFVADGAARIIYRLTPAGP